MSRSTTLVLLVCGLPGCGKSTFARDLLRQVNFVQEGSQTSLSKKPSVECHHIEYDHLQNRLLDDSLSDDNNEVNNGVVDLSLEAWRKSRTAALEELRSLLQESSSTTKYRLILLDDNFHLRSMRKQVFKVCQKQIQSATKPSHVGDDVEHFVSRTDSPDRRSILFATIWIQSTVETCLRRNACRSPTRRVSEDTIHRIKSSCEPPIVGSEAWEVHILSLSDEDNQLDIVESSLVNQALSFVQSLLFEDHQAVSACVHPEVELARQERERDITRASYGHQLDQASRKWVGAVAQLHPCDAKLANKIRKSMLREEITPPHLNDHSQLEKDLPKLLARRLVSESSVDWTKSEVDQLLQVLSESRKSQNE